MYQEFWLHPMDDLFCPGQSVSAQGHLSIASDISRAPDCSSEKQNAFKSRRNVLGRPSWLPLDCSPPGPQMRTLSLRQKANYWPMEPPLSLFLPVVSAPPTKISLWILPSSSSKASQRLRGKSYFLLFAISSMMI